MRSYSSRLDHDAALHDRLAPLGSLDFRQGQFESQLKTVTHLKNEEKIKINDQSHFESVLMRFVAKFWVDLKSSSASEGSFGRKKIC